MVAAVVVADMVVVIVVMVVIVEAVVVEVVAEMDEIVGITEATTVKVPIGCLLNK